MTTDNRTNEPTEAQVEAATQSMLEGADMEVFDARRQGELRERVRAALVAAQGAAPQADGAHQHEWDAETTPPRMTCECAAPVLPSSTVDEDALALIVEAEMLSDAAVSEEWPDFKVEKTAERIARAVAEWLKEQVR